MRGIKLRLKRGVVVFSLALFCVLFFTQCQKETNHELKEVTTGKLTFERDRQFGHVILNVSLKNFEKMGFHLGDSCNIEFSNGKKIKDVPYYNGYYVELGDFVICAYPGSETINLARSGSESYSYLGLKESDTITISLNQPGKYTEKMELLNLKYSSDRLAYKSDKVFANFREIKGGNLKRKTFYRSASCVDNRYNRAETVVKLMKKNKIKFDVDLSTSTEKYLQLFHQITFNKRFLNKMIVENRYACLDMSMAVFEKDCKVKTVKAYREMMKNDGPYLIHCLEGKDRTGFFAILTEALTGATYDEMKDDYMKTYENYYGISRQQTERYELIVSTYLNPFLKGLADKEHVKNLEQAEYKEGAIKYLKGGGMNLMEIEALIKYLSK